MHKAAEGGQLKVIKFLLPMFGARVHEKDSYGYTTLHWAAQGGHRQVARYLIDVLKMAPQNRDKVRVWGVRAHYRNIVVNITTSCSDVHHLVFTVGRGGHVPKCVMCMSVCLL